MSRSRVATHASPQAGSSELKDVVLGIDLGSTSTRAVLWCPADDKGYHVAYPTRDNIGERYPPTDFSSVGYPFDDGPVYLGEDRDASRESTSLKYAFYILADASAELASQYELCNPLVEHKDDEEFRSRLEQGIWDLFTEVNTRVLDVCNQNQLKVPATIALSVPSQWTLEFIILYRQFISEVFGKRLNDIFVVTEIEALAHYLFKKDMQSLIPSGSVSNVVAVILDFGGHTMNTGTVCIVPGRNGSSAFYLNEESAGAAGGSELWECFLADKSLANLQNQSGFEPTAAIKQGLLDSIHKVKCKLGSDYILKVFCHNIPDGERNYEISLGQSDVETSFQKALQKPWNLADERITKATRIAQSNRRNQAPAGTEKPVVVLTGGTANHMGVENHIKDICSRNQLSSPIRTNRLVPDFQLPKIACGAAIAVASAMTVGEFLERGAGFGLQLREPLPPGAPMSEHQWDNTAFFLWSPAKRMYSRNLEIIGGNELKIICDPFFDTREGWSQEDKLHHDLCYDFIDLGKPTKGHWRFSLEMVSHRDQTKMIFHRKRLTGGRPKSQSFTLLLHYNRGSNTIHPGKEIPDEAEDDELASLRDYSEFDQQEQSGRKPALYARRGGGGRGHGRGQGRGGRMPQLATLPDLPARRTARRPYVGIGDDGRL